MPGDLPAERLMDLVRLVDPRTFADTPLAVAATAGQAVLASEELLERARVDADDPFTAADLDRLAVTLKRHAPWTCDLALVPWLAAAPSASAQRWERQQVLLRGATGGVLAARGAALAALVLGLARRRPAAAVAALGFHAAPALATAGTAARPADLVPSAARADRPVGGRRRRQHPQRLAGHDSARPRDGGAPRGLPAADGGGGARPAPRGDTSPVPDLRVAGA